VANETDSVLSTNPCGPVEQTTFPNQRERARRREREREREESDEEIAAKVCFPLVINYFSGEMFTNSVV
jgi:hypothetical protein